MVLGRTDGFIGVMIDDLTMKGVAEPCASAPNRRARSRDRS
jgi:tRNA U34 5-carboxymethylaminomethyl modifying enzyme MnmG/GidA